LIRSSLLLVLGLSCTFGLRASAQDVPQTPFNKQLSRIDLGISAAGEFTPVVSGPVNPKGGGAPNQGSTVSDTASNTVGALANLRYVAKPYVGFEFNFTYARYTENYSYAPFGVQTNVDEYTFGYIATPPHPIFGLQPWVSVGAGSTRFKPTPGGGQNFKSQARATYYYSVGVQKDIYPNFGARVGFRQAFFLAPDFGQNYLTILQHTFTSEPTVGFYLRF
jgi:hypothetical protein